MKRSAEALTVSCSRLAEQAKKPLLERQARYSNPEDEVPLPMIRDIIDHRLAYGYRRVYAVLNHRLKQEAHACVNHSECTGSCTVMTCFGLGIRIIGQSAATRAGHHA